MNVLFVYGIKIKEDNEGNYYTNGSFNMEVWKRYLALGEKLTILCRKETALYDIAEAQSKFSILDKTNIELAEIDDRLDLIKKKQFHKLFFIHRKIEEHVLKHDILIIRLPSRSGSIAIRYARKHHKPYLVEVVGCARGALWYHSWKGKFLAPGAFLRMRKDVRKAPYVLYVSKWYLQKRYPTKGQWVGCPDVVLEEPKPEILQKRLERIQNMHSEYVLGLVGSLNVGYRGHGTLMKAMAELKKRNINCRVRFLGEGNRKKWMAMSNDMGVAQQVEFDGILPPGLPVLEWIDEIDILVMPARQETLGRAIIEAMSRGCPVIGSIETAIGEQIGADCLCKAKDFHAVADLIQKMVQDKEYMQYCAYENYYRSFKYTNAQTEKVRNSFFDVFKHNLCEEGERNERS